MGTVDLNLGSDTEEQNQDYVNSATSKTKTVFNNFDREQDRTELSRPTHAHQIKNEYKSHSQMNMSQDFKH